MLGKWQCVVPFSYEDYKATRKELIETVNNSLTETDKDFLISYESGRPEWSKCSAGDLSKFSTLLLMLTTIMFAACVESKDNSQIDTFKTKGGKEITFHAIKHGSIHINDPGTDGAASAIIKLV